MSRGPVIDKELSYTAGVQGPVMAKVQLNVNGRRTTVEAEPDTPLLYVLRNELGLHATKFGCGLGQCGACTVLVGGRAIRSCETPVKAVARQPITTLEGLGSPSDRTRCRPRSSRSRRRSAGTASTAW